MDLSQNRTYELFLAQVQGVTLDGLMATVPGNAALRYVLVQQPAIHGNSVPGPGAWLLIGSLDIAGGSPPRAHTAWLLGSSAPNRKHGTITRIHHSGAFGEITDPQGKKLFFHVSELPPGSSVHVGQRVSYVEGLNAKGWLARRVRPD
jgi:cold shock CspA family protein